MTTDCSNVRLICPFIKISAIERLLAKGKPDSLQVITRFNLDDFACGVSDLKALRQLLNSGAKIRGVKHLHAKLYLFGNQRAVVTSANLTEAALTRNHEFGFVADSIEIADPCRKYFDNLWDKAGADLTNAQLAQWEQTITAHLAKGDRLGQLGELGDEGTDAGVAFGPIELPPVVSESQQAFVKFFGESNDRADRKLSILSELKSSGSHWACTYPKTKRPISVKDGAIMFMARLVKDPNDILIYGRAIGLQHVKGRDEASRADIAIRNWKETWPHYVRVHHAEFVAGNLTNGISLNELMQSLKADAFLSTQRNKANGEGNIDPRNAYKQQPAVELSPQGLAWLNEKLQSAFKKYGTLPAADLATLDWPLPASK